MANKKWLLFIIAIAVIFLSLPSFYYFMSDGAQLKKVMMICALFVAVSTGMLPPLLVNYFPTEIRYTGIATSYNISIALFGGLAPFISTLLVKESGQVTSPAIYVTFIAAISLIALFIRWPEESLVSIESSQQKPD